MLRLTGEPSEQYLYYAKPKSRFLRRPVRLPDRHREVSWRGSVSAVSLSSGAPTPDLSRASESRHDPLLATAHDSTDAAHGLETFGQWRRTVWSVVRRNLL